MNAEKMKIGQLLLQSGTITEPDLEQRLTLSKQLGMPLGQILIQSGDLSKAELMNAIQVQSLALEGLITLKQAVQLLKDMHDSGISLELAIEQAGLADQHLAHRLGELLMAAGHLTEDNLAWALLTSGEIGVPLGHILIQTGVVTPQVVGAALSTQRQLRAKEMTTDEAVKHLKSYAGAASAS